MMRRCVAAAALALSLLTVPTTTETAAAARQIMYADGSNRTGYYVEWGNGTSSELPPKRVAVRKCRRAADHPKRCIRRTVRLYRRLDRLTSAKWGRA